MSLRHIILGAGITALAAIAATPAAADIPVESGFGFHSVGLNLGLVNPENVDGTIAFGGHANMGAPFASLPQLAIVPHILYWSKSEGSGDNKVSLSEFSVVVDGRYYFPVNSPLGVYAGGGIGFHRGKVSIEEQDIPGFGTVGGGDASDTDIGITFLGGVDTELGETLRGSGEFRFKFGGIDEWFLLVGIDYLLSK